MAKAKRQLPPRMRSKITSSGKTYYYYETTIKPRKTFALGADYYEALLKYADFEKQYNPKLKQTINAILTFRYVAERYIREVLPSKAVATQKGNLRELESLYQFFDNPPAPINDIEPVHIREYLDWRGQTAKTRANREAALFSHIFNKAREWGYTSNENPCRGVKKFKETGRDVYVSDEVFWKVYDHAEKHIQYLILVAYLASQRVADILKIKLSDIQNDELCIQQNKSQTKVRIRLTGALNDIIKQIIDDREDATHDYLFSRHGNKITYEQLRYGMDKARNNAGVAKEDFQFRDLRAKAGTDKDELAGLEAARELLGHKNASMTQHYIRHRKGKLVEPTINKLVKIR
jgi:integrase